MPNLVLTDVAASITELKKNPIKTVMAGEGSPVAILNRDKPAFYCVPAELYHHMIDRLEDAELNRIADSRAGEEVVKINLNDL